MRVARIKEAGASFYHILSRVVDRRMVMNPEEKERVRTLLRAVEAFSGCEVLRSELHGSPGVSDAGGLPRMHQTTALLLRIQARVTAHGQYSTLRF